MRDSDALLMVFLLGYGLGLIYIYEFVNLDATNTLMNSEVLKGFIAEFDRHWAGKVNRTRELVEFSQVI